MQCLIISTSVRDLGSKKSRFSTLLSNEAIFLLTEEDKGTTQKRLVRTRHKCQSPWQTGPSILECYMLRPFALPVASFCVLLGVVAQFGLNRSTKPTTPNISFVPWSPKRGATIMLAKNWSKLVRTVSHSINQSTPLFKCQTKDLFTWSGGPRSSGVAFFCFHALGDTKQKKPTPLNRGPPLHVNRV